MSAANNTSPSASPGTHAPVNRHCCRCVLDAHDDPALELDESGVCNHCRDYADLERQHLVSAEQGEMVLRQTAERIRRDGAGRQHDCVIGLSGGADSSYVAYLARELGLRPLVVHFDNGWNSELAVQNIERIVSRLGFDLFTYVVDWEEFRDLQLAYLKASVVDIEAITDHAILATLYQVAARERVHTILSGTNIVTEAVLPSNWIFNKHDAINIKAIHAAFGTSPLRTFPLLTPAKRNYYLYAKRITTFAPLNFVPYNRAEVKQLLSEQLGWRDYGGKHYESVWTRFYQGYILPRKFGIDKRKAHLSTLICSGQVTREQALEALREPMYDEDLLRIDHDFVLRKFGLTAAEFEAIMARPPRPHTDFAFEGPIYDRYPMLRPLQPLLRAGRRLLTR